MGYKQDTFKDFAERTLANLDYILEARKQSATVYETTQLVNSMLGLITFPKERNRVPATKLEELDHKIWPKAEELKGRGIGDKGKPKNTLRQVVTGMRNAVSHALIEFTTATKGGRTEITGVRFRNDKYPWELDITIANLEKFIRALSKVLLDELEPAAKPVKPKKKNRR